MLDLQVRRALLSCELGAWESVNGKKNETLSHLRIAVTRPSRRQMWMWVPAPYETTMRKFQERRRGLSGYVRH